MDQTLLNFATFLVLGDLLQTSAMCLIFEEGPRTKRLQSSVKFDAFKNWSQETIQPLVDLLNP